jgi:hypothetical protein
VCLTCTCLNLSPSTTSGLSKKCLAVIISGPKDRGTLLKHQVWRRARHKDSLPTHHDPSETVTSLDPGCGSSWWARGVCRRHGVGSQRDSDATCLLSVLTERVRLLAAACSPTSAAFRPSTTTSPRLCPSSGRAPVSACVRAPAAVAPPAAVALSRS